MGAIKKIKNKKNNKNMHKKKKAYGYARKKSK